MNHFFLLIRCIFLIFFIGIFSSCKNKEQEYLLQESVKRLEQQNECLRRNNETLHSGFHGLMYDDDIPVDRISYLEKDEENFHKNATFFSMAITSEKKVKKPDAINLYRQYTALQMSYRQLKNRIRDSFNSISLDIDSNAFMNLNEKSFSQKYIDISDSNRSIIKLTFLEADALLNEHVFMKTIINYLTPVYCYFNPSRAIAITNNCPYKKGDKLEITTLIVKYYNIHKAYAIIDNRKIEPKDGIFNYSRTITEAPGKYKVPIKVYINARNREEIYPAEVTYKVE